MFINSKVSVRQHRKSDSKIIRYQLRTCFFKTYRRLFYILIISIFSMCCSSKAPTECKKLCGLSEGQQYALFKSYPPEKQLDLYISCENEESCSRDSESPHDYYGQWMARDKKALPVLLKRLQSEENERTQGDIIYVLRFMAVNGHLKGEHDVPKIVNQAVANMRGSFVDHLLGSELNIKQSEQWAKEIEANVD